MNTISFCWRKHNRADLRLSHFCRSGLFHARYQSAQGEINKSRSIYCYEEYLPLQASLFLSSQRAISSSLSGGTRIIWKNEKKMKTWFCHLFSNIMPFSENPRPFGRQKPQDGKSILNYQLRKPPSISLKVMFIFIAFISSKALKALSECVSHPPGWWLSKWKGEE